MTYLREARETCSCGATFEGPVTRLDHFRTSHIHEIPTTLPTPLETNEAVDLLRYLIRYEDEPCRTDHHGYCQDHPGGSMTDADDRPDCMVAAARRIVEAFDR